MTMYAKIIIDSVSSVLSKRVTTFELLMPRFIWAEVLTHRAFSRNASSSRATPVARLCKDIAENPAMPVYWGANQKGMQAGAECFELVKHPVTQEMLSREDAWRAAADSGAAWAMAFSNSGYHKQISNRPAENLGHIKAVVTATDWDNFYELRRHEDAQPEVRAMADVMWAAALTNTPQHLRPGQWHLPYITTEELLTYESLLDTDLDSPLPELYLETLKKCSAARCARVSYFTHEGRVPDIEKDLNLFKDLVGSRPLHASPCEHQCTPDEIDYTVHTDRGTEIFYQNRHLHGNLKGWVQFRKVIETKLL